MLPVDTETSYWPAGISGIMPVTLVSLTLVGWTDTAPKFTLIVDDSPLPMMVIHRNGMMALDRVDRGDDGCHDASLDAALVFGMNCG